VRRPAIRQGDDEEETAGTVAQPDSSAFSLASAESTVASEKLPALAQQSTPLRAAEAVARAGEAANNGLRGLQPIVGLLVSGSPPKRRQCGVELARLFIVVPTLGLAAQQGIHQGEIQVSGA